MEWDFNFIDDNILVVKSNGEYTHDDLRTMLGQIISDNRWKPDKNIIIDFTDLIVEKISVDDIYSSLAVHRQFNDVISGKIAVINKNHSGHGISTLYEEVSRKYIKSEYASFTGFDDAVEWIRGDQGTLAGIVTSCKLSEQK